MLSRCDVTKRFISRVDFNRSTPSYPPGASQPVGVAAAWMEQAKRLRAIRLRCGLYISAVICAVCYDSLRASCSDAFRFLSKLGQLSQELQRLIGSSVHAECATSAKLRPLPLTRWNYFRLKDFIRFLCTFLSIFTFLEACLHAFSASLGLGLVLCSRWSERKTHQEFALLFVIL